MEVDMEENFYLQNCGTLDALSSKDKAFKISYVKHAIKEALRGAVADTLHNLLKAKGVEIDPGASNRTFDTWKWFDKGLDCEILKVGAKGWQKGKIRIKVTLEFIPDEPEIEQTPEITQPESPLDDIRRMINEATA